MLVTLVSGCDWIGPGADASRSGYNPNVTGLTATKRSSLTPAFRTELDGGAGAAGGDRGRRVRVLEPGDEVARSRTGAIRWSTPVPEPDRVSPGENVLVDPANRRVLQVRATWQLVLHPLARHADRGGGRRARRGRGRDGTQGSRLAGVRYPHTGLGPTFTSMSGTDISILLCISSGTPCLPGPPSDVGRATSCTSATATRSKRSTCRPTARSTGTTPMTRGPG